MKKLHSLLSIALALALVLIVATSAAFACQARDGTAPMIVAQPSIAANVADMISTDSPATISPPVLDINVVTTISPPPAFARGTSLKIMVAPSIEVRRPLLCHSSALANSFDLAGNFTKEQVTVPATMASSKNIHSATGEAVC